MPEWPELRVMQERIAAALVGKTVVAVRVGDPVVLRALAPVDELLVGRTLRSVAHHGKFLVFGFDGLELTVNPMLAGIFTLQPVGAKATKDTRLRLEFEGGTELRYRDDVRMGKVYVGIEAPGLSDIGPDAGTLGWIEAEFAERAKAKRSEVRNLLQDQTFVSGIGNAYADEILWAAQLHPKRRVGSLTAAELHRLYTALRGEIARGLTEVAGAMPSQLGEKPRAHMRVRGHAGEPCPRCGTTLIRRRKGLDDVDLCPTCQPAPKGQLY
ncbi:MAG TPA: DNA-formamidopyrimidine glycosylase family protein [Candidatus Limnocylindria bacterium]|nr:DNA-formamidopyrimidine glycosylase family protein [Candidatus Limnocylindria bacterium]